MPWIGIECNIEANELVKWGNYLEQTGGGAGQLVGAFLRKCAGVVSGAEASSLHMDDRMREIESRAVASIERQRLGAMMAATNIVRQVMDSPDDCGKAIDSVMVAAGVKGWTAGREAGNKNGGIKASRILAKRRKRKFVGGGVVRSNINGSVISTVERRNVKDADADAKPKRGGGQGVYNTMKADKSYANTFMGWCGTQLRIKGFKMTHVARALGTTKTKAWTAISGYNRYWKRQALAGVIKPVTSPEWQTMLEDAMLVANGVTRDDGNMGAPVVLNGTRDCGAGPLEEQ